MGVGTHAVGTILNIKDSIAKDQYKRKIQKTFVANIILLDY